MPGFAQTLVGIGPICDAGFTVTFSKSMVIVRDTTSQPVLTGWREPDGPKLWHFNLLPEPNDVPTPSADCRQESLAVFSAYDMPSVQALVRYFHAAAGFPVRDTWLNAIKNGNYSSWPGLTYSNAAKYCPSSDATLMGHMIQTHQNVRSTKPRSPPPPSQPHAIANDPEPILPPVKSHELHIRVKHISRMYTAGRFPVRSCSGNQYVMIAYHCDANVILACPFKTRADAHRLEAYANIMERLKLRTSMSTCKYLTMKQAKSTNARSLRLGAPSFN